VQQVKEYDAWMGANSTNLQNAVQGVAITIGFQLSVSESVVDIFSKGLKQSDTIPAISACGTELLPTKSSTVWTVVSAQFCFCSTWSMASD
jgi:hypothetical protein